MQRLPKARNITTQKSNITFERGRTQRKSDDTRPIMCESLVQTALDYTSGIELSYIRNCFTPRVFDLITAGRLRSTFLFPQLRARTSGLLCSEVTLNLTEVCEARGRPEQRLQFRNCYNEVELDTIFQSNSRCRPQNFLETPVDSECGLVCNLSIALQ